MAQLIALLQAALVFGTVILFGAIGEILTEKSGNLNLGVPGIMYLGGIAGLAGAFGYENSVATPIPLVGLTIALLSTIVVSVLAGGIYSVLTITLRANQNVTGLTLTIFGAGAANFFGGQMNKLAGGVGQISVATTSGAFRSELPTFCEQRGQPTILKIPLGDEREQSCCSNPTCGFVAYRNSKVVGKNCASIPFHNF